jgi:hypothetical protein
MAVSGASAEFKKVRKETCSVVPRTGKASPQAKHAQRDMAPPPTLDHLETILSATSNTDKCIRLVVGTAMALTGMSPSPNLKLLLDDCAGKATSARHLVHMSNGPGQLKGLLVGVETRDPLKVVLHTSMLGFLLNEHLMFVASLKPVAYLGLDASAWLRRNAMCMNVFFIVSLARALFNAARALAGYLKESKEAYLTTAFESGLLASTCGLDLLITLTRSGVRPIITTAPQMGVIGMYNSLVGLYLEWQRVSRLALQAQDNKKKAA